MIDPYSQIPEIMYDEDGAPMAVRVTETIDTPAKAMRRLAEEHDWIMDDFPCFWLPGDEYMRPVLSAYRAWRDEIKRTFYRPAENEDEFSSTHGEETWHPMSKPDARGIEYFEVRI